MLAGARGQGTSRAPKLKIREIRAIRMKGINSRFVRVYTDQGLTGTKATRHKTAVLYQDAIRQ